jgi:hypothetical protein
MHRRNRMVRVFPQKSVQGFEGSFVMSLQRIAIGDQDYIALGDTLVVRVG